MVNGIAFVIGRVSACLLSTRSIAIAHVLVTRIARMRVLEVRWNTPIARRLRNVMCTLARSQDLKSHYVKISAARARAIEQLRGQRWAVQHQRRHQMT